jgi:hypothetical protein
LAEIDNLVQPLRWGTIFCDQQDQFKLAALYANFRAFAASTFELPATSPTSALPLIPASAPPTGQQSVRHFS